MSATWTPEEPNTFDQQSLTQQLKRESDRAVRLSEFAENLCNKAREICEQSRKIRLRIK